MEQKIEAIGVPLASSSSSSNSSSSASHPAAPAATATGLDSSFASSAASTTPSVSSDNQPAIPSSSDLNAIHSSVFSNIEAGIASISAFTEELQKYLVNKKQYFSDSANRDKEFDNIIKRFIVSDLPQYEQSNLDSFARKSGDSMPDYFKSEAFVPIKNSFLVLYFSINYNLFDKLSGEVEINKPRFLKNEHTDSEHALTVNFAKIVKDLKKAQDIFRLYKKKIKKLESSMKSSKKKSISVQHHNTIEFAIFLAFKLFKFEILEYFLYIRDSISSNHEIWKVLNFREVYQTLFSVVLYFEYCSSIITLSKQKSADLHNTDNRNLSVARVWPLANDRVNKNRVSSSDINNIKDKNTEKEDNGDSGANLLKHMINEFDSKTVQFNICVQRIEGYKAQVYNKKSLYTAKVDAYFSELTKNKGIQYSNNFLKHQNKLKSNLVDYLYEQQPMYETLNFLIINYHLRYLKLIAKFVDENKDSNIFQINLLPVKNKSGFNSTSKFETLIRLIQNKIKSNVSKLRAVSENVEQCFKEADSKILATDKYDCLKKLPSLTIKSMKIFNDSFAYIYSLIPLFPSPTRIQVPTAMGHAPTFAPPPPIPASIISPFAQAEARAPQADQFSSSSTKRSVNGSRSERLQFGNSATSSNDNEVHFNRMFPSRAPSQRQLQRHSSRHRHHHHHHARHHHNTHLHNNYHANYYDTGNSNSSRQAYPYNSYYNSYNRGILNNDFGESFLSTSWFVIYEIKKRFQDLIHGSFARYSNFLMTLDNIDELFETAKKLITSEKLKEKSGSTDDLTNKPPSKKRKLNKMISLPLTNPISLPGSPLASGEAFSTGNGINNSLNADGKRSAPINDANQDYVKMFASLRFDIEKQYGKLIESIDSNDNMTELMNFIIV